MSRKDPEFVAVNCDLVYASNAALLIREPDGKETWLPRSGVKDGESWPVGTRDVNDLDLEVAEWLATREGLI